MAGERGIDVISNEPTIVSLRSHTLKGGPPSLANADPIDIDQVDAQMSDGTVVELFLHRSGTPTPPEEVLKGLTLKEARDHAAKDEVPPSMAKTVAVSRRQSFSDIHLGAAVLNARLSEDLENDPALEKHSRGFYRTYPPHDRRHQHTYHGVAAITLSFAALEAAVAEAFITASETYKSLPLSDLDRVVRYAQMAAVWTTKPRRSSWDLARVALEYAGKAAKDIRSWEEAEVLKGFRNRIVHAAEESMVFISNTPGMPVAKPTGVEEKLIKRNLGNNPFADSPHFPSPYLGHKTVAWAVATARSFIVEFYAAVDMPSPVT